MRVRGNEKQVCVRRFVELHPSGLHTFSRSAERERERQRERERERERGRERGKERERNRLARRFVESRRGVSLLACGKFGPSSCVREFRGREIGRGYSQNHATVVLSVVRVRVTVRPGVQRVWVWEEADLWTVSQNCAYEFYVVSPRISC